MKICVISFDFWNYDSHIVDELRNRGIDAHHINIGTYRHKNLIAKIKNAFSKVVFRRNLKNENRQKMILNRLNELGKQDQILVINPELIQRKYHIEIKKCTDRYKAYLYDSLSRCPAEHLFDLFDEIFSFDQKDAQQHGFKLITNYNYLPEKILDKNPEFEMVYLASYDKRLQQLYKIIERLDELGVNFYARIIGKKSWKKMPFANKKSKIKYGVKRISHNDIPNYYKKGKALLDLIRENQTGLSFRIFEAMALKKKIITNNPTVQGYDFYNPNNILVLNDDLSNLEKSFFETDYEELDRETYQKYTLKNWVKTVFNL